MTPHFTAVHISGLWDAHPDAWTKAARIAARHGQVVTYTEATLDRWANGVPAGWESYHSEESGQDDPAAAWDPTVFALASEPYTITLATTQSYSRKGKPRARTHALIVALRHLATGKVVIFLVCHFPSAVDGRGGFDDRAPRRVLEWVESATAARRAWTVAKKIHPGARRILVADFNLDFRQAWVRAYVTETWPLLRSGWERLRGRGTAPGGKRFIDAHLLSGGLDTTGTYAVPGPGRFDHDVAVTPVAIVPRG